MYTNGSKSYTLYTSPNLWKVYKVYKQKPEIPCHTRLYITYTLYTFIYIYYELERI